jgi:polyisoprenoid-binding protein YceI
MSQTTTANKWAIDPTHSDVQFKIKHLVISTVTGTFKWFEGSVLLPQDNLFEDADIHFRIDVDSIDTNQESRDQHLKNADFFDVEKYPHIEFRSTSFTRKSGASSDLRGLLTMHGETREVSLHAEYGGTGKDAYGNTKVGFEVAGKINRKEFGLTYNALTEAGGLALGEDVKLTANIQLAKAA